MPLESAAPRGLGENMFGVVDMALGAKKFAEGAVDGRVEEDFVGEAGSPANGLAREPSEFAVAGGWATFLGLVFVGDFGGLSRMFLKMFDVFEPELFDSKVAPLVLGVLNCRRGLSLGLLSLVSSSAAFLFPLVNRGAGGVGEAGAALLGNCIVDLLVPLREILGVVAAWLFDIV